MYDKKSDATVVTCRPVPHNTTSLQKSRRVFFINHALKENLTKVLEKIVDSIMIASNYAISIRTEHGITVQAGWDDSRVFVGFFVGGSNRVQEYRCDRNITLGN